MASTPPTGPSSAARRKKLLISAGVSAAIIAAILLVTLLTILQRVPETQPPGPGPSAKWNPRILSTPPTEAEKGKLYSYTPTANETVVWQLATNATWLSLSQGKVQGTPDKERTWFTVSIKAINQVEGAAWQNYTLRVKPGVAPPVEPPPEELPPEGPPGLYNAIETIVGHLEMINNSEMPEAARFGQQNALDHLKVNLQRWVDKHGSDQAAEHSARADMVAPEYLERTYFVL